MSNTQTVKVRRTDDTSSNSEWLSSVTLTHCSSFLQSSHKHPYQTNKPSQQLSNTKTGQLEDQLTNLRRHQVVVAFFKKKNRHFSKTKLFVQKTKNTFFKNFFTVFFTNFFFDFGATKKSHMYFWNMYKLGFTYWHYFHCKTCHMCFSKCHVWFKICISQLFHTFSCHM